MINYNQSISEDYSNNATHEEFQGSLSLLYHFLDLLAITKKQKTKQTNLHSEKSFPYSRVIIIPLPSL